MSDQDEQNQDRQSQLPEDDVAKHAGDDEEGDPEAERTFGDEFEARVEWRMAKSLDKLRAQINEMAPNRSKVSDGGIGGPQLLITTKSDHWPWVNLDGLGIVTARDFTHDPAGGCDAGALAEKLRRNQDPRIKYVIWNRRIFNAAPVGGQPAWAWRPYAGRDPHDRHVHVSVLPDQTKYDDETPWNI